MVSLPEYQQQLQVQQQQVEQVRINPTQAQLRAQTPTSQVQYKEQERLLNLEKARAVKEIMAEQERVSQAMEQQQLYEEQKAAQGRENAEWLEAKEYISRGPIPPGTSPGVVEKYQILSEQGYQTPQEYAATEKYMKEQKPMTGTITEYPAEEITGTVSQTQGWTQAPTAEQARQMMADTLKAGGEVYYTSTGAILTPPQTTTQKIISGLTDIYTKGNVGVKTVTEPIFIAGEKIGISAKNIEAAGKLSPFSVVGIGPFGFGGKTMGELSSGIARDVYLDVREQPLKQALLLGGGYALGAGTKALTIGAAKISPMIGNIVKGTTSIAGLGLGAVYGYDIAKRTVGLKVNVPRMLEATPHFLMGGGEYPFAKTIGFGEGGAKDVQTAGGILGVAAKDIFLTGYGYVKGERGAEKLIRWTETIGRERIILPKGAQGEYPSAPRSQHLKQFKENIVEGLSYKKLTPAQRMKLAEDYANFNLKQQLTLKEKAIYPQQHAYPHMKEVGVNVQKIIQAYPEYQPALIKRYGSLEAAKTELTKGMWHDIMKVSSSSADTTFGGGHGEIFYDLWKKGKLPEGLQSIKPEVAKAIRYHEVTSLKNPSIEWKILTTADRLEFSRFKQGVDISKLPLKDVFQRIPSEINFIEPKIKVPTKTNLLENWIISGGKVYPKGAKPIEIHTTGNKFWGKEIIPKPGSSELSGIYGSTKVSQPFLGIQGEETRLLPSLRDLFTVQAKPAIAVLKPTSFKSGEYVLKRTPAFEGQRAVGGKFAHWITPAEKGVSYVPGMKTEIEAISRPESGGYLLKSAKYYDVIGGLRIRVDLFEPGIVSKASTGKTFTTYYNPPKGILGPGSSLLSAKSYVSKGISVKYSGSAGKTSTVTPSSAPITSSSYLKGISSSYLKGSSTPPSYTPPSYTPPSYTPPSYTPPSYSPPRSFNYPSISYRGGYSGGYGYSFLISPSRYPTKYGYGKALETKYKEKRKKAQAYIPLIKRRGKFVAVGFPTEKGKALRTGERAALRTAAATFKVIPKGFTTAEETKFTPSKLFRSYKIEKGKPVQLKDTFIQRTGKRIVSRGEKLEISYKGITARRKSDSIW